MKTPLILFIALFAAVAGIFTLRHRELRALETRAAVLKRSVETPSVSAFAAAPVTVPVPAAPDRRSILKAIRELRPRSESDQPKMEAILKDLSLLRVEELKLLFKEAVAARPVPEGFAELIAILAGSALTEKEPSAALAILTELPPGFARDNTIPKTLASWLKENPGAAAAWIRKALANGGLKDYKDREHLPMMAMLGEVMAAPVESLERIRKEPEGVQRSLLNSAVRMLQNPEDARAVAAAVIAWPVREVRESLLSETIGRLLELDSFDATSAWLDGLPEPSPEQRDVARIALALRDAGAPETARRAAWVLDNAAPEARPALAARLTWEWARHDHDAAGGWLNANRSAPWYDAGAKSFAETVSQKEPATAFDWSLTISDETMKREALRAVMRRWRKDNPEAALEYVKAAALPAEWIAEFTGSGGEEAKTDTDPANRDEAGR